MANASETNARTTTLPSLASIPADPHVALLLDSVLLERDPTHTFFVGNVSIDHTIVCKEHGDPGDDDYHAAFNRYRLRMAWQV